MAAEKKSIVEDRIRMLYEAIRDEQATIFNIDWKARSLLTVNSITVPLIFGSISLYYSLKKDLFNNITLQNPVVLLLFVVSIFLLSTFGFVFYFTLKVIHPRIGFGNKAYPEEWTPVKDLDVFFPRFQKSKVDYCEYKKKLKAIKNRETLEDILLSELLCISMIRDDKVKTLNRARNALGINAVLTLVGIFLFLLLII